MFRNTNFRLFVIGTPVVIAGGYVLLSNFWDRTRQLFLGERNCPPLFQLYGMPVDPHREFADWALQYGPVFTAMHNDAEYIILCSYGAITEASKVESTLYGRPYVYYTEGRQEALTHPESLQWKTHRIYVKHVLDNFAMERKILEGALKMEIDRFLIALGNGNTIMQRARALLLKSIANSMFSVLTGRHYDYGSDSLKDIIELIDRRAHQYNCFSPRHCLPYTANKDWERKNPDDDLNLFTNRLLEAVGNLMPAEEECGGYMDAFARHQHEQRLGLEDEDGAAPWPGHFNSIRRKNNITLLLEAGIESIGVTMEWAIKYMAHHQDIQERVYRELVSVVGMDGTINFEKREDLPYCCATMQEVLRIAPALPLGVARSNTKKTVLSNFCILPHKKIFSNLWAVHHDPLLWTNPEHFRPERHLDCMRVKNSPFLMPFGTPPLSCPGESVAVITYFFYFTMLLMKFKIQRGPGINEINFEAQPGFTYRPDTFEVEFVLRNPR